MPSTSLIFSIVPPRPLVLSALLRQDETTFLVLFREHQRFDMLADLDDLVRINVVAYRQLAAGDHAFGLVADVEEDFVFVDLDDGALDELTVLDGDHGPGDGIFERGAEVIVGDLAGGVRAVLVERPEGRGGNLSVGQGDDRFR